MEEQINQLVSECKSLDLTKKIGEDIEITDDWETIIEKVVLMKKFIKEMEKIIDDKLLDIIRQNPEKVAYEGARVKLLYYPKTTYAVGDGVEEKYTVNKKAPNRKTIEAFFNLYQSLPKGVTKETNYSINKSLI